MTVKDFMNAVFRTKVTIFNCGEAPVDFLSMTVMPKDKNWEQFADLKITEIEAVAHYGGDAEIYLMVE